MLPNGTRLKGPMFHDQSLQKLLREQQILNLFTDYVKYPRTLHLPWSKSIGSDDKVMLSTTGLEGEIILTEKLDGENTSMYRDYIHARSLNGNAHPSQNWVRQHWASIAHEIPQGWRICGENMYAQHSIKYENLETYFYGISIFDDQNNCLAWNEGPCLLSTRNVWGSF